MTKLVHRSGGSNEWKTDQRVLDCLLPEFRVTLDVCAADNHVANRFYTVKDDGLAQPWDGSEYDSGVGHGIDWNWWNCPYSGKGEQEKWARKAM